MLFEFFFINMCLYSFIRQYILKYIVECLSLLYLKVLHFQKLSLIKSINSLRLSMHQ